MMLSLTAVFSYGFLVTHQTVGIDDTPYAYYFRDGLVAIVGRWVLFLLNKIFHIADFAPFITDLAGVLILMTAVTVWCTLLYTILKRQAPMWGYLFFSCIFLSCPLISEVYTYYLHNGVSIGYLCVGLSLCFYRELLEGLKSGKRILLAGLGTVLFLWIALGCYESFMIVWLLGVFLILLSERYGEIRRNVLPALCVAAAAAAAAMVLRSVMIEMVIGICGLGEMRGEAVQRSVGEMISWMLEPNAAAEFAMVLKRIFVMYGVFAYAYYPIRIFLLAAAAMLLSGLCQTVCRRDVWCLLLTLGSFFASFILIFIEGSATLYRSAQFLPVICGYGVFLTSCWVEKARKFCEKRTDRRGIVRLFGRTCSLATVFVLCAILWNQCFDMNRWFYIDWMKYESARTLAGEIAHRLKENFDSSKPVMFTGTYQAPRSIIGEAYVSYGSETFYKMNRITGAVDEHLLEKFYRDYGVWVAQTPALSVIDWGRYAFGDDSELIRFFAMHGYELRALTDDSLYQDAEIYSLTLPSFPAEGSVVDMGEYIIVHF